MSITLAKQKQGLLFSEPSIGETRLWYKLKEGIDPAEWAKVCRHLGTLNSAEFERISAMLMPKPKQAPRSSGFPIVSIGPGKPGDAYQWEI